MQNALSWLIIEYPNAKKITALSTEETNMLSVGLKYMQVKINNFCCSA